MQQTPDSESNVNWGAVFSLDYQCRLAGLQRLQVDKLQACFVEAWGIQVPHDHIVLASKSRSWSAFSMQDFRLAELNCGGRGISCERWRMTRRAGFWQAMDTSNSDDNQYNQYNQYNQIQSSHITHLITCFGLDIFLSFGSGHVYRDYRVDERLWVTDKKTKSLMVVPCSLLQVKIMGGCIWPMTRLRPFRPKVSWLNGLFGESVTDGIMADGRAGEKEYKKSTGLQVRLIS